ncbi:mediator complex protein [Colletotrichum graminicola]|uniref:Mediator of RNA polymerase II transcription subunit 11 n=1 Tax=Colletotrichum graminicola (strain M1.001 / M2 / FGSC 10212) TaxID=645133 RepID=E3Q4R5_COLGM|nr:mediator complex protein [Colletotrichum graminicola M1.001]EFQ26080.1 mediator complex protein [Colletotrichum graminicola M1.001]WDK23234.1 mediator complex protein [Colletotrichum graminicola]
MTDSTMTGFAAATDEPFTLEERIKQLCDIDANTVQLMRHTSSAMSALGAQQGPDVTPEQQKQTFQSSMDALLSTLHAVDVHMKRQIMGLEEAGIVKLRSGGGGGAGDGGSGGGGDKTAGGRQVVMNEDAKVVARASLEPNGVGTIGNLDVGWLNSRNNKVERDMEAELWAKMRDFLERYHAQELGADGEGGGMQQ